MHIGSEEERLEVKCVVELTRSDILDSGRFCVIYRYVTLEVSFTCV